MTVVPSVSVDDICRRGSIKDTDVARLRRLLFADAGISAAEAHELFRINTECRVQDASWVDFFIEAITDHLVNEAEPRGYLTAANAEWLIAEMSRDGRIDTKTELELLVNLLDKARWSPESLVRFALEQVKHAVISATGPLRAGSAESTGTITEADVELIRRIIYAFSGDGNLAVTRAEAEVLFEINDAISDEASIPAWTDLFVKGIANCVMSASGYAVPSREEALRREVWMESRGDLSLPNLLKSWSPGRLLDVYREQTSEERALARLEKQRIEIITNEEVTQGEVAWLAERLSAAATPSFNERALLAYIERESPKVHPSLTGIFELQAAA